MATQQQLQEQQQQPQTEAEQPLPELAGGLADAAAALAKVAAHVPDASDIHYFKNIPEYRDVSAACSSQAEALLHAAAAALVRPSPAHAGLLAPRDADEPPEDQLLEQLTAVLDDTLERLDTALEAAAAQTEAIKLGGWALPAGRTQQLRVAGRGPSGSSVASMAGGGRVQRHVASLPRPQDAFDDALDNSNAPWSPARFSHLAPRLAAAAAATAAGTSGGGGSRGDRLAAHAAALAAAASGTAPRAPHPFAAELAALRYQPWQLQRPASPAPPPSDLDAGAATLVDTPAGLAAMLADLAGERQIALDLEHHSYRSFLGFTCLMQLSTRRADWLIDTLALRSQLGPALAPLLADAGVEKVLHGANSDVLWLQRDFGLYLVNMFDTGQAARALAYPSASLAHLLERHAGFVPDKRYQLADWRVRPLPPDMAAYAAADTHFLLGLADVMKDELRRLGDTLPPGWEPAPPHAGATGALGAVYEASRLICCSVYDKPLFSETAYLQAALRWSLALPPASMAVFAALYAWRDATARALDESVSYVLPKASLIELARAMPTSAAELRRLLGRGSGLAGSSTLVLARADEVAGVIARAQAQGSGAASGAASASSDQQPAPAAAGGSAVAAAAAAGAVGPASDGEATGQGSGSGLKPRELPPLKPRQLGALSSRQVAKSAGSRAGGARSSAQQPNAAAAAAGSDGAMQQGPASEQSPALQSQPAPPPQQPDQPQPRPSDEQLPEQAPREQPGAPQQGSAGASASAAEPSPEQPSSIAPAPKQLAAPARKAGSLRGLFGRQSAARPQRGEASKASALKAGSSFQLAFLVPAAAAAATAEAAAGVCGQQQPPPQAAGTPCSTATAAAGSGAQRVATCPSGDAPLERVMRADVRAVVDELMAQPGGGGSGSSGGGGSSGSSGGEPAAAAAERDEPCDDTATAAKARGSAGLPAGLADLEYLPLSSHHAAHKRARRPAPEPGPGPAAAAAEQHAPKRKRGLFEGQGHSSSDSDSDSSQDSGHEAGAAALPVAEPGRAAQRSPLDGTGAPAAQEEQQHQVGGGRRGGRGSRGRGGSRRGGMAAATASLAAVRQRQGGSQQPGRNFFEVQEADVPRGKRKAGSRTGKSATFRAR